MCGDLHADKAGALQPFLVDRAVTCIYRNSQIWAMAAVSIGSQISGRRSSCDEQATICDSKDARATTENQFDQYWLCHLSKANLTPLHKSLTCLRRDVGRLWRELSIAQQQPPRSRPGHKLPLPAIAHERSRHLYRTGRNLAGHPSRSRQA